MHSMGTEVLALHVANFCLLHGPSRPSSHLEQTLSREPELSSC